MSGFIDIEKHIEDTLVKGLRVLFTQSTAFKFDVDKALSAVEISMGKPRKSESDKPGVFVTGITYSVSDMGLSDGEMDDILDSSGRKIGYSRASKINFSANIMCAHEKSPVSKNLSNEVLFYLWFTGKNFMRAAFQTNINNIQKSGNGRQQLSENRDLYVESVGLSGEIFIKVKFTDLITGDILNKIEATYKDEFGNVTRFDVY